MLPAAKHFDCVLGLDTHVVLIPTPGGPVPTPLPHPFVGSLFDPKDYIPGFGATVRVNGLPRAHAGTAARASLPHVPLCGRFVKQPANEGELLMGSSSVAVEDAPMGFSGLPVLTCQDFGMPAPQRTRGRRKPGTAALFLPTSIVLSIPAGAPVTVGGAPVVSMSVLLDTLTDAAKSWSIDVIKDPKRSARLQRRLKGARRYLAQKAGPVMDRLGCGPASRARNRVRRSDCTVTGHPVDVPTGKVFTDCTDLTLPGPLPFALERVWFSTSTADGPLGHGWHASFDMALASDADVTGVRLGDGRVVLFPALKVGEAHFEPGERMRLCREADGYRLHAPDTGRAYRFARVAGRDDAPLVAIEVCGDAVTLAYDGVGRLCVLHDSAGHRWTLHHEGTRIAALEGPHPDDASARVTHVRYGYDAIGNLVEVIDALGQARRFAYAQHLMVRETDRNGLSFHFVWEGRGADARCVRTWGDGGLYARRLTYDRVHGVTTVEDSRGLVTRHEHDGAMVHRSTDALGRVRSWEHGPGYRVLAEIDALGQRTEHEYDARGNRTRTVEPGGVRRASMYDAHDRRVQEVDAIGGVWRWSRDEAGRVVASVDPRGDAERRVYEGARLVATVDPAGAQTTYAYDALGNLETVRAANGAITRHHHDRLGRLIATVDPHANVTRWERDLLGRPVRITEPDGSVRLLSHDAEGNVLRARDALRDVRFAYAGMNRLIARSEAGTTVQLAYDTEEQLTAIVNEHGHAYGYRYGPTGLLDEERCYDGATRRYHRDAAGRVLRVEARSATREDRSRDPCTTFAYDPSGRVVSVQYADGSRARYAYRADGALCEAENDACLVRFERDPLGRVVREQVGEHWVKSEHDARGQRVRTTSSLGVQQTVRRDERGDVRGVFEERSGFAVALVRDRSGRELARSLPGEVAIAWQRDLLGRPLQQTVSVRARELRSIHYDWGDGDRLRATTEARFGTTAFGHDARGRLAWARAPDGTMAWRTADAVGNLFRSEARSDCAYGAAGQLLRATTARGTTRYAYDAAGNLSAKREPDGQTWRYAWDGAGMLARVTRPDGTEVALAYDALGRRIAKTHGDRTTRWVWDGDVPLHEWSEHAAEPARAASPITWLFMPDTLAPLARLDHAGPQSIVCDFLGTPVAMTRAEGQPAWEARLDAYGRAWPLVGEAQACPFRWPGQYADEETGLHYNRFRHYDPSTGAYASRDPIRLAGGLALHAYVADPLVQCDPFGLASCKTTHAASAAPSEARLASLSPDGAGRGVRVGAYGEAP